MGGVSVTGHISRNSYSGKFIPSNVIEPITDQEFLKHVKALKDFSENSFGKIENPDDRRLAIWESAEYLSKTFADSKGELRQRALEVLLDQAFSENTMVRNLVARKLQGLWKNTKEVDRSFFRDKVLEKLNYFNLAPGEDKGFTDDPKYQQQLADYAPRDFCNLVALMSPRPVEVKKAPEGNNNGGEQSPISTDSRDLSFTISEMNRDVLEQKDDVKNNCDDENNVVLDPRYEVDEKGFNEFDRMRMKCDYSKIRTNSYSYISDTRKTAIIIEKPMILTEKFVRKNFEARTLFVNRESGFETVLEGNCIYKTKMDDFDEKELRITVPRDPQLIGESRTLELSRTHDLAEQVKKLSGDDIGAVRLLHDRERNKYGLLFLENGNHFLFTDNQRGQNVGYVDQLRGQGNWGIFANNESKPNKFDLWVRRSGPFKLSKEEHWEYLTGFLQSLREDKVKTIHPSAFYRMFNEYLEDILSIELDEEVGGDQKKQESGVRKSDGLKMEPEVPEPNMPPKQVVER